MNHETFNTVPLATTVNLLREFPTSLPTRQQKLRNVPVGIEVEVPWRAFFPDLWVDGFPNVDEDVLNQISKQCSIREQTLVPRLMKSQECGIKRGADRYWEFALDPVTDVGIACDHIAILRQHELIPKGRHSLHITFGGIRVTPDMYYAAMCLEAYACSPDRVLVGFHPTIDAMSSGWARKGYAGLFQKEGSHDIQHGMHIGAEIRLLWLPDTDTELFDLLSLAQHLVTMIQQVQSGNTSEQWSAIKAMCKAVLAEHNLPDRNWKKPHMEPAIWRQFAECMPSIQRQIRSELTMFMENIT